MQMKTKLGRATAAALAAWIAVLNLLAQQPQKPSQPGYVVRVATEVVLVNVIARDKKGNLVRDLKKEDFTVYEDGQKQQLSSFDFENVDELATAGGAGATVTGAASTGGLLSTKPNETLVARGRRLMLLFFDFSAMEPDEIDRAVDAGKKYVQANMQPADMVALVSLATSMRLDQDLRPGQPEAPRARQRPAGRIRRTTRTTTHLAPIESCWPCNRSCKRWAGFHRRRA